ARVVPESAGPPFDPAIQAILDKAKAKERQAAEARRTVAEREARFRRAHAAWLRVSQFRGDAIPEELTGDSLNRRYAELIVDLGQILKADGWQDCLDAVSPGSDAKTYAVEVLRRAMEGDTATVRTMVRESVSTLFHLGLTADGWLREGLMYEVLGIR